MVCSWHHFTHFLHRWNRFFRVNLFYVNFQIVSLGVTFCAIWTNKGSHSCVNYKVSLKLPLRWKPFPTLWAFIIERFSFLKTTKLILGRQKTIIADGTVESNKTCRVLLSFLFHLRISLQNYIFKKHSGHLLWTTLCLTKLLSCSRGTPCWLTRCLTSVFLYLKVW